MNISNLFFRVDAQPDADDCRDVLDKGPDAGLAAGRTGELLHPMLRHV